MNLPECERCRRTLLGRLHRRAGLADTSDWRRAAVVAPHFDDEVLGCGATMLRLAEQGRELHLVYVTDGSRSHEHLLPTIAEVRHQEAAAVARALNLPLAHAVNLDFKEGFLEGHVTELTATLEDLLRERDVDVVFSPYGRGEHPDHTLTNACVREAVTRLEARPVLLEYPVWAWHSWPFSDIRLPSRSDIFMLALESLRSNLRLLRDMNVRTTLPALVGAKRNLLDLYRSQMTQLVPDDRWKTLRDVGGGRFIENFFTGTELFHRVPDYDLERGYRKL